MITSTRIRGTHRLLRFLHLYLYRLRIGRERIFPEWFDPSMRFFDAGELRNDRLKSGLLAASECGGELLLVYVPYQLSAAAKRVRERGGGKRRSRLRIGTCRKVLAAFQYHVSPFGISRNAPAYDVGKVVGRKERELYVCALANADTSFFDGLWEALERNMRKFGKGECRFVGACRDGGQRLFLKSVPNFRAGSVDRSRRGGRTLAEKSARHCDRGARVHFCVHVRTRL